MPLILLLCAALLPASLPARAEPTAIPQAAPRAAWITYWDAAGGLKEAVLHEQRFDSLIYFAAYFDQEDGLYYPGELAELHSALQTMLRKKDMLSYLSFVNDATIGEEEYELKSQPLLRRLLQQDAERAAKLSDDIIALTLKHGYQGIEIDFEGILSDLPLWESFFAFLKDLYPKAQAKGLPLRVLLEPRTPFDQLSFPEGPEYVLMCYNLFGTHSGPGPKADRAFLEQMVARMSNIPAKDRGFALALGGFDWSGGKVTQLTMHAAQQLLREKGAALRRVEEAATFTYTDAEGGRHEVWYADEVTLAYWTGVLNGLGEDRIDFWKLGENLNETL